MKVSVLMPVYNCDKYIGQAIQSVLDQTYSDWELLITDDASTDNTVSIIRSFIGADSRIRLYVNPENQKLLRTRNKLLDAASGDLITFQDGDDYSHPQRLELMVKEFEANPSLGVLGSQVAHTNERGKILRVTQKPTGYKDVLQRMYEENVIGDSTMMIKKEALQEVGGKFREYFDGLSYQDYDLSLLLAEKFEAYSLPQVLYYYRQYGQSTSKTVSVDRLLARKIVSHLARQRQESGEDDLMQGKPERVNALFEALRAPYKSDASLVYLEYAANYMYNRLYKKALNASLSAIRIKPLKFVNWRTFQYCARVSFLEQIRWRR